MYIENPTQWAKYEAPSPLRVGATGPLSTLCCPVSPPDDALTGPRLQAPLPTPFQGGWSLGVLSKRLEDGEVTPDTETILLLRGDGGWMGPGDGEGGEPWSNSGHGDSRA